MRCPNCGTGLLDISNEHEEVAALRRDLASAREREGRLRKALESIANGDYWAPQIAAEALAGPAADAGEGG